MAGQINRGYRPPIGGTVLQNERLPVVNGCEIGKGRIVREVRADHHPQFVVRGYLVLRKQSRRDFLVRGIALLVLPEVAVLIGRTADAGAGALDRVQFADAAEPTVNVYISQIGREGSG